jgi:FkbM family methyltransferase
MNNSKKQRNLIFDVGMHKGEDTDYYLKKGFNVIAFEADPYLVELCSKKFAREIKNKQLIIVHGAIVKITSNTNDHVQFYRNKENSVWGTVLGDWAERNEILGTSNEIIDVPVVNFAECIVKYGMPYYLKIDIEGMDTICLESLFSFNERPDYISIESEKISFKKLKKEIALFKKLGYNRFKAINQSSITKLREPVNSCEGKYLNYQFLSGSSGPFGRDLPKKWVKSRMINLEYWFIFLGYKFYGDNSKFKEQLFFRSLYYRVLKKIFKQPIPGWYDTHAKYSLVE